MKEAKLFQENKNESNTSDFGSLWSANPTPAQSESKGGVEMAAPAGSGVTAFSTFCGQSYWLALAISAGSTAAHWSCNSQFRSSQDHVPLM